MSKLAVGMEVGSSAVRLAAVSRSRSGPVLQHIGEVALGVGTVVDGEVVDPQALGQAVKALVKSARPGTKKVRLGVVSPRTVARQVDLPWVPEKEFKRALPLLAEDMLPMPAMDCVLDFMAYEDRLQDDGSRVLSGLLVAAPEQGVLDIVDAVETSGMRVTSVTLTPLSTLGAVADAFAPGPEALIDVGQAMSSVTIHEHSYPHFVRVLSRGGRDITSSLAEQLGLSLADAETWKCGLPQMWSNMTAADRSATETAIRAAIAELVADIRTSIDFYSASEGRKIERAYVVGGGGGTLGLVPTLASVLRVPVIAASGQLATPGRSLSPDERGLAASPAAAAVVGLALGAS